ncbi:MAG: GWxTD domain-containing protein [Ignavibacteriaceae bacterium]|nr:GWxTD domain-containing protein [Ignavibacteriaceae bacterium]
MKLKFIFIIFLLAYLQLLAQVESSFKNKQREAVYYQDFLNFAGDKVNQTQVDVFIQVPYNEIQFVKSEKGFSAGYSVTISVFTDDKSTLISEKTFNEKVEVVNFEQTISGSNFNLSLRSFYLRPGAYLIRSEIEDKDSKQKSSTENLFEVRDYSSGSGISDIMLIARKTVVEGSNKILPNVNRNVFSKKDGIPFYFEVYSRTHHEVKINSKITENENIVYDSTEVINIDSGKTKIFFTVNSIELGLGNYLLQLTVVDMDNKIIGAAKKTFLSRWQGVPSSIKDLDKAAKQLVYIAKEEEIDKIEEAINRDEKIKAYLDFWKTKDPTPQTEDNPIFDEYYRRVAYANEKFSHYTEGWKTDRGMVFIILGPPDNVDRHPFEFNTKPYEIWEYYDLNRQFIFVDETGFDDYRLITPMYGDSYRYRQ